MVGKELSFLPHHVSEADVFGIREDTNDFRDGKTVTSAHVQPIFHFTDRKVDKWSKEPSQMVDHMNLRFRILD
jgi:hypothetical protein